MAKRRRSNVSPVAGARRRNAPLPAPSNGLPPGTKQIDAADKLDNAKPGIHPNDQLTIPRAIGMTAALVHSTLPALISWGLTVSLIFGGCCSNVFALEAIVKEESESGLLITLTQFLVTALFAWPAHFSASRPPFFLKPRAVPLVRWLPNIVLFFTVNMLNNFAFGYDISVPVHIILRSGGSVTTIVVGFLWGKRFTRMQVFSVAVLTIGVIIAAMADAQSKGKDTSTNITANTSFMTGLVILFLAQLLSAIMGLYTQATYTKYGPHWNENLFYSHFLSLPLFIPFLPSLRQQLSRLLASPAFELSIPPQLLQSTSTTPPSWKDRLPLLSIFASDPPPQTFTLRIPKHLLSLALNSLTQYACIRGVNLLAARTTALGVTIVLNIRKLVSLFASIWLFGNKLPPGVLVGAAIVFGAGGVYAWEGQRISKREAERKRT